MTRLTASSIAIMSLLVAASRILADDQPQDENGKWIVFVSKEGHFSVQVPANPKVQEGGIKLDNTKVDDGVNYAVRFEELTDEQKKSATDQVLDALRDRCVKRTRGKILSEGKIRIGDYA